ncbi:MAG: hypothetical protein HYR52_05370, partial [Candidatus Tectomicrobia bacterium]|nr:hypothetical protein [Candidatus Tectomicrobia bacterium]
KLYEAFQKILPSSGSIDILRTTNMANPIRTRDLQPLADFLDQWNHPENHFLNADLEMKKQHLYVAIDNFYSVIEESTFGTRHPDFCQVPREWIDNNPQKYHETIKELNSLARKVVETHAEFVKAARTTLNC